MPPLGHCGHLGQWAGGQSNCPPPPHGHCKHQGQWAASYQGQWNNYCEGMATNHHGPTNWDGPGGCCRGSIQAGCASGFSVGETNIQGEKMPEPQRSYKNHLVGQRLTLKHNNEWQKRP